MDSGTSEVSRVTAAVGRNRRTIDRVIIVLLAALVVFFAVRQATSGFGFSYVLIGWWVALVLVGRFLYQAGKRSVE